MIEPRLTHWKALRWILKYLYGTLSFSLRFKRKLEIEKIINENVDSNYPRSFR